MNMTPRLKAIGLGALVALLLYASGLLVILSPLPLLWVYAVHGRKSALLASAISAIVVVFAYSYFIPIAVSDSARIMLPIPFLGFAGYLPADFLGQVGVGYFIYFAILGMIFGEGVRSKWGLVRLGGTALAAGLFVFLLISLYSALFGSGGVVSGLNGYVLHILNQTVELNKTAGTSGIHIDLLMERGDVIAVFIMRIIPALLFVYTLLVIIVNILVGRRVFRRGRSNIDLPIITGFRLPDVFIWPVIATGLMFFLNYYLVGAVLPEFLALNSLIALLALYFFQGMAIVAYMLNRVKSLFFRMLTYLLIILFFQPIGLMIVALGVADVWVDFRTRSLRFRHHHSN